MLIFERRHLYKNSLNAKYIKAYNITYAEKQIHKRHIKAQIGNIGFGSSRGTCHRGTGKPGYTGGGISEGRTATAVFRTNGIRWLEKAISSPTLAKFNPGIFGAE